MRTYIHKARPTSAELRRIRQEQRRQRTIRVAAALSAATGVAILLMPVLRDALAALAAALEPVARMLLPI